MNDDRWKELIGDIKVKFGIESQEKEDYFVKTPTGQRVKQGEIETVIFNGEAGRMKMERISRPKILEKKVHSHRRKANGWVEYVTSDEEKTHEVKAYLWNPQAEDWKEMDLKNF